MDMLDDEPPLHPGTILKEDFLTPLGISRRALAAALFISPTRAASIVAGDRRVTADMALRLARYFGTSPWFWMDLQVHYDLEMAGQRVPGPTAGIVPLEGS